MCSPLTKGKNPNRFRKNKIPFLCARSSACLWDEQAAATIYGENGRAILTLTQLLQTPYSNEGWLYGPAPITPAFLRLDPAFRKLCEQEQDQTIIFSTEGNKGNEDFVSWAEPKLCFLRCLLLFLFDSSPCHPQVPRRPSRR
jgi:hypothetical protein